MLHVCWALNGKLLPCACVLLCLQGVWGGIVRQWLHELLPADAVQRCSSGRVQVVLITLPCLQRLVVSEFKVCASLHNWQLV
jgi:hypothetical protein